MSLLSLLKRNSLTEFFILEEGFKMLWLKAFHIVAMVAWFAGLFYLPRLFVYHTQVTAPEENERFKTMERRLYKGIMTPSAIVTIGLGVWMLIEYAWAAYSNQMWLHWKIGLVGLLVVYHFYCGYIIRQFALNKNRHGALYYRIFNEIPVIFLVGIVLLVTLKQPS